VAVIPQDHKGSQRERVEWKSPSVVHLSLCSLLG